MKDKIIKLKNGGIFIYSKTKLNNCSAVEVGFRVGAVADKKMGTAHFLEHTLFKKTKNRTNAEVEADRNRIVFLNASTSMDYLLIKMFRTNKLIDKSLDFVYDVLMNSVIDDEYVETEKGVIKEELNMCLDGESRDPYITNMKQAMSTAAFASDIVGKSEKNISSIKFKDLVEFKNNHFIGNNLVVSMVTSLSFRKAKKLINKKFAETIPYNENYIAVQSYYDKNVINKDSSLKIVKNLQDKISVLMSFKIAANELDIFMKDYNYSFLTRYLSGSQGDLFLKLRNKGLIYRLDSDISSFKDESLFNIVFETSKEKIKDIIDIIADEVKFVVNNEIGEKVTDAYKKNLEYYADEKMPVRLTNKCHLNFMDYLSFGKLFRLTNKQKKNLRNGVKPSAVKSAANIIFNKNTNMYVTVLGNVTKSFVPTIEEFKEKFLISEVELWVKKQRA